MRDLRYMSKSDLDALNEDARKWRERSGLIAPVVTEPATVEPGTYTWQAEQLPLL